MREGPALKIIKNDPCVCLPEYGSEGASGMDLRAFIASDITIPPLGRARIATGLKIEIPIGFEAQIRPRSGLAANFGITVLNSPGTIDSDYRGDLEIILVNFGEKDFTVKNGDRIAQMVIASVCRADLLETDIICETKRGTGGFGSTGI